MNKLRIINHPILGIDEKRKKTSIMVDGSEIEAYEDEPIAIALLAAGIKVLRRTKKLHEPRGIFCAIGLCTDCVMIVNGRPNIRTCITAVEKNMDIKTQVGSGESEVDIP